MIWTQSLTLASFCVDDTESKDLPSRLGRRLWQEGCVYSIEIPLIAEIQPFRQGGTNVQMHPHR